jgi:hypothetical protein
MSFIFSSSRAIHPVLHSLQTSRVICVTWSALVLVCTTVVLTDCVDGSSCVIGISLYLAPLARTMFFFTLGIRLIHFGTPCSCDISTSGRLRSQNKHFQSSMGRMYTACGSDGALSCVRLASESAAFPENVWLSVVRSLYESRRHQPSGRCVTDSLLPRGDGDRGRSPPAVRLPLRDALRPRAGHACGRRERAHCDVRTRALRGRRRGPRRGTSHTPSWRRAAARTGRRTRISRSSSSTR